MRSLNPRRGDASRCAVALLLAAGLGGLAADGHAQSALSLEPGAVQQRSREALERLEAERKLRAAAAAARAPSVEAPRPAPLMVPPELRERRVYIDRIELDRSAVLPQDELEALCAPYTGREIRFGELDELLAAINARYAERGYLARAVLPPQRIRDGVVRVRLVEAKVGALSVRDNASTAPDFITDRVTVRSGEPVELGRLRDELLDFNLRNDLALRAELAPGADFGTTDVVLRAVEPPRWESQLLVDNAGAESIGEERVSLEVVARSLFGYRDRFVASGIFGEGARTGSLFFDVPAGRLGTRVGAGFDASDIDVVAGPLEPVDVGGTAQTLTAQITHPFLVRPGLRLEGYLAYQAKRSSSDFFGVEISEIKVRELQYGGSLTRFDATGSWFTRQLLISGIEGLGGDQSFLRYRGEVQRWQQLGRELLLRVRVEGQWSDIELLPPSEQFQVGGQYTVRGFREGLLIGDDGYLVNVELRRPLMLTGLPRIGPWLTGKLDGRVFIDHGAAFPFKGAGGGIDASDFLTSAGFGLDLVPVKGLTIQFTVGFPIGFRDDGEGYRGHFLVRAGLPDLLRP